MDSLKTDTRVLKTKNKLKETLLLMLTNSELSKITVRQLTREAGIGFKTFYRHYSSIYDFATKFILDELNIGNRVIQKDINKETLIKNGIELFILVDNKYNLFQLLKYGEITQEIVPILKKWTAIGSRELLEDFTKDALLQDLIANHIVYSIIGLITWRSDNRESYSTKEMGKIYYDLIIKSNQYFLKNIAV